MNLSCHLEKEGLVWMAAGVNGNLSSEEGSQGGGKDCFWGLARAPPLPSCYAVLRATKASGRKKTQKIAPAFKELIAQQGRPDTTEFSSKLDGHGSSEQRGGLTERAGWLGRCKRLQREVMAGKAHQRLIRWRWAEGEVRGTMVRTQGSQARLQNVILVIWDAVISINGQNIMDEHSVECWENSLVHDERALQIGGERVWLQGKRKNWEHHCILLLMAYFPLVLCIA